MEWLRKYGGWIISGLLIIAAAAKWLSIYTITPEEKELHEQMAKTMEDAEKQNELWNNTILGTSDEWQKKEKGNDSDTLLIAHYDSLANACENKFTAFNIRKRINELKGIQLQWRTDKILKGKWKMVAGKNPSQSTQKKQNLKYYIFNSDHTLSFHEQGKNILTDSFRIITGNGNGLILDYFPVKKDYSVRDVIWKDFYLNGDSLIFKTPDCPECSESIYIHVTDEK